MSEAEIIGAAASAISVGTSAWGWVKDFRDLVGEKAIIAALFTGEGDRIDGSDRIAVLRIADRSEKPDRWWFRFVEVVGYLFVAVPVDPGIITAYGRQGEEVVFQFKEGRMAHIDIPCHPGPFLVLGYQPQALVAAAAKRDVS